MVFFGQSVPSRSLNAYKHTNIQLKFSRRLALRKLVVGIGEAKVDRTRGHQSQGAVKDQIWRLNASYLTINAVSVAREHTPSRESQLHSKGLVS